MKNRKQKPDLVIKTCKSTLYIYEHYEKDIDKANEAMPEVWHALRYIASQEGWIQVLDEMEAITKRIIQLEKRTEE